MEWNGWESQCISHDKKRLIFNYMEISSWIICRDPFFVLYNPKTCYDDGLKFPPLISLDHFKWIFSPCSIRRNRTCFLHVYGLCNNIGKSIDDGLGEEIEEQGK